MATSFHTDLENRIATAASRIYWDELPPVLVSQALAQKEGTLAHGGALAVTTGVYTGRSVKDKFIVRDALTDSTVWWGKTNVEMSPEHFAALKADFLAELAKR